MNMETPLTCPYAHHDGAYVLGALSPAERLEFERHLAGCDDCTRAVRRIAGLPGLLGKVDPAVLEQPLETEPVPETLLPTLTREVRRGRRRRTRTRLVLAAAAAAVVAAVALVAVTLGGDGDEPVAGPGGPPAVTEQMAPVGDVPVRASLTLQEVAWGTRLDITCTYDPESVEYDLPPAIDYLLVVRTDDGRTERVGSWRSIGGKTMEFTAGTASDRDDISSVEVRAPGGRVALRLTL